MSGKFYDVICIIQRWIVALGLAYYGLSAIWGFPFADEINKSAAVIATFLATIIEIEKSVWNKSHSITITDFTENNNEAEK